MAQFNNRKDYIYYKLFSIFELNKIENSRQLNKLSNQIGMNEKYFKVLIVDDESEARGLLRYLLSSLNSVKVIGEAENAEKALYLLVEHSPNLIFLDINMPGKTGVDLVHLMRGKNINVPVVFISAHSEYAIEAIRNEVYDFLLKPVDKIDLQKIVSKYQRLNNKNLPGKLMEILQSIKEESKIQINSNHSYILVNPSEIVYCIADNGSVKIHLNNGKTEISNGTLTQIESRVKAHNFYRMGRSILINQDYIREIVKKSNKCILKHKQLEWVIEAPKHSIKNLLINSFNYA